MAFFRSAALLHGPDAGTRMADMRLDLRESVFQARPEGSVVVRGKSLTQEQIAKIKQRIEEGAEWKEHLAYRAPVQNTIDRFGLAKLASAGLSQRLRRIFQATILHQFGNRSRALLLQLPGTERAINRCRKAGPVQAIIS